MCHVEYSWGSLWLHMCYGCERQSQVYCTLPVSQVQTSWLSRGATVMMWQQRMGCRLDMPAVVGVFYRQSHLEKVDKTFFRHLEATLNLQILEGFNQPSISWRSCLVGSKQPRKVLECTDDTFLMQVIKVLMGRGALLDLNYFFLEARKKRLEMQRLETALASVTMR